jgi:hypothetical protein
LLPALGAALVLAFALPVFLVAGWRMTGWALAALLWLGVEATDALLARVGGRDGNLAASGVQAFGMFFKALGLLAVLLAAAVTDPSVAAAAAVTFGLAYTAELGLSLLAYFGAAR